MAISMEEGIELFDEALEHHGILGMKWGVQNGPPYPLGAEDHNASERKAGWQNSLKSAGSALIKGAEEAGAFIKKTAQNTTADIKRHKEARAEAKREKEENTRRAAEEQRNMDKRSAINNANIQYAEENFADMSDAEIRELLGRVDLKQKVDKVVADNSPQKKTFVDKVNNISNGVNTAMNWANTGINAWNTVAKVWNSINDEKLPVIDGDYQKRKNEEIKRNQNEVFKAVLARPDKWTDPAVLSYLTSDQVQELQKRKSNIDKLNDAFNGGSSKLSGDDFVQLLRDNGVEISDKDAKTVSGNFEDNVGYSSSGGKKRGNTNTPKSQPKVESASSPQQQGLTEEEIKKQYQDNLSKWESDVDYKKAKKENVDASNYLLGKHYEKNYGKPSEELDEELLEELRGYSTRHSGLDKFEECLSLVEV